MTDLPSMPVWVDEMLAEKNRLGREWGAFIAIVFSLWKYEGRLPDDDRLLAQISGVSLKTFTRHREKILRGFLSAGGEISFPSVTKKMLEINEIRRKRSDAARAKYGGNMEAIAGAKRQQKGGNQNQNQIEPSSLLESLTRVSQPKQKPLPLGPVALTAKKASDGK